MSFELGEAFVSVRADTDDLQRDVRQGVDSSVDGAEGTTTRGGSRLGKKLALGFGTAFVAAGGFSLVGSVVETGATLEQIEAKADTVFGNARGSVDKWAEANARAMGLTQTEAVGAATSMGDLLVPMGMTRDEAAEMSTEVVGLSGALSEWSQGKYDATEVSAILTKAMLGEREQLKELGISISQEEVNREAATVAQEKYGKSLEELTPEQKAQADALATQNLIMDKTADAQDAYAEGADTATRKQAEAKAMVGDLKEALVGALFPAFQGILNFIMDRLIPGIQSFVSWLTRNKDTILTVVGVITAIFLPALAKLAVQSTISAAKQIAAWAMSSAAAVGAAVKTSAQIAIQGAKWAWLGAKSLLGAAKVAAAWLISMGPIALVIAAVVGLVVLIVKNFDTIKEWIGAAWEWVKDKTSAVWGAITGFFSRSWETIKRTFSNAVERVKSTVKLAFLKVVLSIREKINEAVDFVKGLPGRAVDALSNLGTKLRDSGKALIQGFVDGITSMVSAPVDAVRGMVENVRNFLPFSPAKEGPFSGKGYTLFSGQSIAEDLAKGISQQKGRVTSAVGDLMGEAQGGLSSSLAVAGSVSGASGRSAGATYIVENVELRASDLREVQDVREFFQKVQQTARSGRVRR